jgi:hypothetical protein
LKLRLETFGPDDEAVITVRNVAGITRTGYHPEI